MTVMNSEGPFFSPGDQKVIGQAITGPAQETRITSSSRTLNRIWLALMSGLTLLGTWCLLAGEWVAGGVLVLVGVVTGAILVKLEISERMMLRRMSKRGKESPPGHTTA